MEHIYNFILENNLLDSYESKSLSLKNIKNNFAYLFPKNNSMTIDVKRINDTDHNGNTALIICCLNRDIIGINRLLDCKADTNIINSSENGALNEAIGKVNDDMINVLLDRTFNMQIIQKSIEHILRRCNTNALMLKVLNIPNINMRDYINVQSLLMLFIQKDNYYLFLEILKYANEKDIGMKQNDSNFASVLHCACMYGRANMVMKLIDSNSSGLNSSGLNSSGLNSSGLNSSGLNSSGLNSSGLNSSGLRANINEIDYYYKQNILHKICKDCHDYNKCSGPPYKYCTKEETNSIILLLINSNIEVNLQDRTGWTPLAYACDNQNIDIINTLMCNGANADIIYDGRNTVLKYACENNKHDTIRTLLDYKTNINLLYENNITVIRANLLNKSTYSNTLRKLMEVSESDFTESQTMNILEHAHTFDIINHINKCDKNIIFQLLSNNARINVLHMYCGRVPNLIFGIFWSNNKFGFNIDNIRLDRQTRHYSKLMYQLYLDKYINFDETNLYIIISDYLL